MTTPAGPDDRPPRRRASFLDVVEWCLLAVVVAAGAAGWGIGLVDRGYDYDEVQRAHSVWLASRGLRPYDDLFEVHPPYFALLSPLLGFSDDPCDALRALRIFAAVGNALFLGGLVALGWSSTTRGGRWAVLGVSYVAFHPRVLDFLVEFRIDGWGYAIATGSLFGFLRRPGGPGRFAAFGLLSGIATLLCPKLALLPPLVVGFDLIRSRTGLSVAFRNGVAYVVGLGTAGLLFALFLFLNGIALDRTYWLLFRYHTLSNANSGYRYGLLREVIHTPTLLAPIALGAVVCVIGAARRRSLSDPYHPALGIWLGIQAVLVAYHYKQYYAPWFLFGSAIVVVLGRSLDAAWRPLGVLVFLAACVATVYGSLGIARVWQYYGPSRRHCAEIRALNLLAGRDDRVVAPPPDHPIARRDVFFLWFNTSDPGGYDSERILSDLGPYGPRVSPEANARALASHPPAFVVLDAGPYPAPYPEGQWRSLLEFLPRRGYRAVRLGALRLALRPDRYDRLRNSGLFSDDPGPLGPSIPRFKAHVVH